MWKSVPLVALATILAWPLASQDDEENEEEDVFGLSPFTVEGGADAGYRATSTLAGTRIRTDLRDVGSAISVVTAEFLSDMGATVGGLQDIRYARDLVARGLIPASLSITPEGLFSEHDLPIGGAAKPGYLFDIATQAIPFESELQPNVDALVQLGFVSGINPSEFKPKPLHLVAVVDRSGSMKGKPAELVRKSLKQIADQIRTQDRLSIIVFGKSSHVHMEPTRIDESNLEAIYERIDAIECSGSTYMEAGLELGYELARKSIPGFEGRARVMLFTDEKPNVGRTDAESFVKLAEAASEHGIGLSTIGVGANFGLELAERLSSVRGGNLFYFSDAKTMEETFRKELDTMVLELAYDLQLRITPSEEFDITGLYGIPGESVEWMKDGSLSMEVATVFASRSKGAIYFGLGRKDGEPSPFAPETELATVSIIYTQADNDAIRESELIASLTPKNQRMEGIVKGAYLIDHYAMLKLATKLYESNEYFSAREIAETFSKRDLPIKDKDLEKERKLARNIAMRITADCAVRGIETAANKDPERIRIDSLLGEWIEGDTTTDVEKREMLRFTDDQTVQLYYTSRSDPLQFVEESDFKVRKHYLVLDNWGQSYRYRIKGDELHLKNDKGSTVFTRMPQPEEDEEPRLIEVFQSEISGLPEKPEARFASNER